MFACAVPWQTKIQRTHGNATDALIDLQLSFHSSLAVIIWTNRNWLWVCEIILMQYHQSWNFIGWPCAHKSMHACTHTHMYRQVYSLICAACKVKVIGPVWNRINWCNNLSRIIAKYSEIHWVVLNNHHLPVMCSVLRKIMLRKKAEPFLWYYKMFFCQMSYMGSAWR
jgi:hypothetical protein